MIPSNTYIKVGKTQRFALATIAEALLKGGSTVETGADESETEGFDPTSFDPDEDV